MLSTPTLSSVSWIKASISWHRYKRGWGWDATGKKNSIERQKSVKETLIYSRKKPNHVERLHVLDSGQMLSQHPFIAEIPHWILTARFWFLHPVNITGNWKSRALKMQQCKPHCSICKCWFVPRAFLCEKEPLKLQVGELSSSARLSSNGPCNPFTAEGVCSWGFRWMKLS